jgi:hypothetical protein
MELLMMQFSPPSCHFIPLKSKYSSQHPVLKRLRSVQRRAVVFDSGYAVKIVFKIERNV